MPEHPHPFRLRARARAFLLHPRAVFTSVVLTAALLTLAASSALWPAHAETESQMVLICDSLQHAQRLATRVGENADSALDAVNAEAENPRACLFASVSYERDPKTAPVHIASPSFDVVAIVITAASLPALVRQTYFMLVPVSEVPA